jgi:ABC-2 type transport system ATP-binding protein
MSVTIPAPCADYRHGRAVRRGEPAMTGQENLEMVARLFGQDGRAARATCARILSQSDLTEAVGRLVQTYSGGMRRKLEFGASLVGAPKVLLLGEPTTGLDPAAASSCGMPSGPW